MFLNETCPAPEMGLGGRQQRKRGVERVFWADSAVSPGRAWWEMSFISRGFSWRAESAETSHVEKAWRRIGDWGQTLSVVISMA
jgi:hypothetical protein